MKSSRRLPVAGRRFTAVLAAAALGFLVTAGVWAAPTDATAQPGGEEKELADLMSIVRQETDVATKTRMNSDFVPGIVTVLDGDELEALGIASAGEALGLVPGMNAVRDVRGSMAVIVRGLDFPFNSGNILLLVNGTPLTRQDAGINSSVLLMPVEQIERIEVIRGPGSVLYGDYAFMGLVNIVTRRGGTRLFGRVTGPRPTNELGGRLGGAAGPVRVSGNVARYDTNKSDTAIQVPDVSDTRWFGSAAIEAGGLTVSAETVQRQLPAPHGLRYYESSRTFEGKYARALRPKLQFEAKADWMHNDISDFVSSFKGGLSRFGANAVWTGWTRQSIVVGADYTTSGIDSASHIAVPQPGQPLPPPQRFASDINRNITGVVAQDQVELTRSVTATLGARYDHYSDLGDRVTPRGALVWRAGERHIVKAQYAEGFRPPTFFELYQPPPPHTTPRYDFEVNATTELNYVYHDASEVARATLFHTSLKNMIRPGGVIIGPHATAKGLELEWERQLLPALKVDANASYVDTQDPRVNGPGYPDLPNETSSKWIGNLSALYRPVHTVVVASRWNHIGPRSSAKGYDTVDVSVSKEDLFLPGLTARAGLKNANDADVTYISSNPIGTVTQHYRGRNWFAQLSWRR